MESITVNGATIPKLGLGTYQLHGETCQNTVREALSVGYRHIDTAEFYNNHAAIASGIATSTVDRDEVFLTTKVWRTNLERHAVIASVQDSLDELETAYVDLLLIHWPNESVPIEETIGAMNRLQQEGQVRHIGVSNFSLPQLRAARTASETPIVTNQVKYNPSNRQDELLEYCLAEGLSLTAYSPLAKGAIVDNATLARIGQKYNKSAAQVALRWLLQQDLVLAIPKTASRDHLRANRDVFDFSLSNDEMRAIWNITNELPPTLADQLST